jgi:1D-myo-inositol-tetrakisphosphate 5-kinase/inositol-polyphosphate multikinase
MIETSKNTTSLETGMRLTGFQARIYLKKISYLAIEPEYPIFQQVHNNVTGLAVNTPKSYGKSIKVADLLDGITKFFPEGKKDSEASAEGSSGLPRATLRAVLEGIIKDVKEIRVTFAELELRIVGGSLLIIYEADWDKAKECLQKSDEEEVDDEEEGDDEDDEDEKALPFAVKLIDFAHTKVVPGQGPDEGVLLGIDSTIKLLNERLLQLV